MDLHIPPGGLIRFVSRSRRFTLGGGAQSLRGGTARREQNIGAESGRQGLQQNGGLLSGTAINGPVDLLRRLARPPQRSCDCIHRDIRTYDHALSI